MDAHDNAALEGHLTTEDATSGTPAESMRGASRRSDAVVGALLVLVVGVAYLATATYSGLQVNDTRAAAVASWSLGTRGTLGLPADWTPAPEYWATPGTDDVLYTNRFPAIAAWGALFYAAADGLGLLPGDETVSHPYLVPFGPAAVAGATGAAIGIGAMFMLLLRLADRRVALGASLLLGLATPVWSVAADALWPHSISLATCSLLLLSWAAPSRRPLLGAGAAAVNVLTRPHLAVPNAWAAFAAHRAGSRRLALAIVVGTIGGFALLVVYSRRLFGTWLPAAGYETSGFLQRLVFDPPTETLATLAEVLLHPSHGMLFLTPALVVLLPWVGEVRRDAPAWARAGAIGGVLYLLVQVRMSRASGGFGFHGYRTALEALYLATPLLVHTYVAAVHQRRSWRWAFWAAAAVGAALTIVGVSREPSAALTSWWARQLQLVEGGIDPLALAGIQ